MQSPVRTAESAWLFPATAIPCKCAHPLNEWAARPTNYLIESMSLDGILVRLYSA